MESRNVALGGCNGFFQILVDLALGFGNLGIGHLQLVEFRFVEPQCKVAQCVVAARAHLVYYLPHGVVKLTGVGHGAFHQLWPQIAFGILYCVYCCHDEFSFFYLKKLLRYLLSWRVWSHHHFLDVEHQNSFGSHPLEGVDHSPQLLLLEHGVN